MKKAKKIIIVLIIVIIAILVGIVISKKQESNRKYEIEQIDIGEYKYFVIRENEKFGVIDTEGNKIIAEALTGVEDVTLTGTTSATFTLIPTISTGS